MAEIKSHTDLEQSRKLAEILPRETADFCWGIDDETLHYNSSPYPLPWKDYTAKEYYVPCWSLAALINLLPQHIFLHGTYMPLVIDKDKMCRVGYDGRDSYKGFMNKNFVDSCVEMILGLHEMGYKKWPRK